MPLYDFRCDEHGKWEVLAKVGEEQPCPSCGNPGVRQVSLPAKTATLWGTDWRVGLGGAGFFSPSVGARVTDKRQEEAIMKSRGFVNEKDLGGTDFYEGFTAKKNAERDALDSTAKSYRENLKKFDGDKARAVTETFPAHTMLEQAHAHDQAKESP
jgi:putative FmdB family regulatory protein